MALAGFTPVSVPQGTRRSAMLLPKPKTGRGHIPALPPDQLARLAGKLGPDERKAMRQLCNTAGVYAVHGVPMLIAPATPELLDTLAAFEAEAEDRENDLCDEPQDEEDDRANDDAHERGQRSGDVYGDEEADCPGAREQFIEDRHMTTGRRAFNTRREVRRLQLHLPGGALRLNRW